MYKVPTFLGGAATPTTPMALSQGGQIPKIEQISDFQISKSSSVATIGEFWDHSGVTSGLYKHVGAVANLRDCKSAIKLQSISDSSHFNIVDHLTSALEYPLLEFLGHSKNIPLCVASARPRGLNLVNK